MLYIKSFITIVVIVSVILFAKDIEYFENRQMDNLIASVIASFVPASIITSLVFLWSV